MPKISVILPVYNAAQYVAQAIKSILDQSFRNFELIIVPNGSNAATLAEIHAFEDERIIVLSLSEANVAEAMNHGIRHAKGKYIARMDADDIAPKHRLDAQYQFLVQNPQYKIATGKIIYLGNHNKHKGYYLHVQWLNFLENHCDIYINRFVDSPVANPSLMMHRNIFEHQGLYLSGPFPEDYEMVLRWLHNGEKIGKVNATVLHWRDHPDRLTRNHNHYSQESFFNIKTRYFAKWFMQYPEYGNEVLIWGTGKSVRKKSEFLSTHGIHIAGYIEVKEKFNTCSSDNLPIFHFTNLPENKFILSYVSDRKGRLAIMNFLSKNGYIQGKHYYMMS